MTTATPVILLAGLPAAGKTTTAGRLNAKLGGALIRSCDVYMHLGISLPDWVRRTAGFTRNVAAYDARRDLAYEEMARLLIAHLRAGTTPVVIDAVHGERVKRRAVYEACDAHGGMPVLLWCRCDDAAEIARRLAGRLGHESEPEHEASDPSIVRYIADRWDDPAGDRPAPLTIVYETHTGMLELPASDPTGVAARIAAALRRSRDVDRDRARAGRGA